MARKINTLPISEPMIVPCLYATGAGVDRAPHAVQLVFWVHTPDFSDDNGEYKAQYTLDSGERRIVARIAMPLDSARLFAKSIIRALRDEGH